MRSMTVSGCWGRAYRGLWILSAAAAMLVVLAVGASAAGWFSDDDGSVHEPAIDGLAEAGVVDGTECGEGLFCPGEPIRRWVMAVWLVRVLDESPSTEAGPRFSDVDAGVWWAPYVERLADLGVTTGCATDPPAVLSLTRR